MKSARVLVAAVWMLLPAFLPRFGVAGTQDGAMIVLHAQAHTTKSSTICTTAAPTVPCSQYTTSWAVRTPADVYLIVVRAKPEPGIAGVSCGIDYDGRPGQGVDVLGYQLCADLEFPSAGLNGEWPADDGGDRITWVSTTNCQRTVIDPDGVHAVACAFYVYAYGPDFFGVTPNWNVAQSGELVVADCRASMTPVYQGTKDDCAGVVFGGLGCNPCLGCWCTEVRPTTWGRVKRSFAD
jgi:hypothetical protein